MTETINWHQLAKDEGMYDEGMYDDAPPPNNDSMIEDGVEYRRLPMYRGYYVSRKGKVRNAMGKLLTNGGGRGNDNRYKVRMQVGIEYKSVYRYELIHHGWPELAPVQRGETVMWLGMEFRLLPECPDYMMNIVGRTVNRRTYRDMRHYKGRITVSSNGRQRSFSVPKMLVELFGPEN